MIANHSVAFLIVMIAIAVVGAQSVEGFRGRRGRRHPRYSYGVRPYGRRWYRYPAPIQYQYVVPWALVGGSAAAVASSADRQAEEKEEGRLDGVNETLKTILLIMAIGVSVSLILSLNRK
jgi:hypothetical protein